MLTEQKLDEDMVYCKKKQSYNTFEKFISH